MLDYIDSLIAFSVVFLLLSLLITVTTQLVGNAINLRGKNLSWGLKKLFAQIQPTPGKEIEGVVEWLLTHPLIARSKIRKTTVIRIEEIRDLLKSFDKHPNNRKGLNAEQIVWIRSFTNAEDASGTNEQALVVPEDKVKKTLDEAYLNIMGQLTDALNVLPDYLQTKVKSKLDNTYTKLKGEIIQKRSKLEELEVWFDRTADRLSERFTVYSQGISIAASICLAVLLQLNAIDLFERVLGDAQLRSQLVAKANIVLQQADEVLDRKSTYNLAMDSLKIQMIKKHNFTEQFPEFKSKADAKQWLQSTLPDSLKNNFAQEYESILQVFSQKRLGELGQDARNLGAQLNEIKVIITDRNYDYKFRIRTWHWKKYTGILVSIVLLSLGAPFWFNALKNLASLRTKIVRKEETEREERQKA